MDEKVCLTIIHDVQHVSLFSHLQFTGSFRHTGQIMVPHPTHVLSALLHAQWLQVLTFISSSHISIHII
jgi:hypothetical protein